MKFTAKFKEYSSAISGIAIVFINENLDLRSTASTINEISNGFLLKAMTTANFKGKSGTFLDVIIPNNHSALERVILIGLGKDTSSEHDIVELGGKLFDILHKSRINSCSIYADSDSVIAYFSGFDDAKVVTDIALGIGLAAYSFEKYKTVKNDEDDHKVESLSATFVTRASDIANTIWQEQIATRIKSVNIARDLVIEPPNILSPAEFVTRIKDHMRDLGAELEILDESAMQSINMNALLGVGQGSARPSYCAIIKWNGSNDSSAQPLVFIGKGVVFDTGGISIKPSSKMEDMKGDMAGAACVTGLMHCLAKRKAKINAVGIVGLVENMPDGAAQRPGDIVTSMSGKTIEIINTDAEGRLVLADLLWYAATQIAHTPRLMVNLATLTGAIVVALGKHRAGLFTNADDLANQIMATGEKTGERVWRMPMDKAYDKLIDSKFADVKNCGDRDGSSITAAQFLQRFVKDNIPWVHLDIAGVATGNKNDISRSWASGWGVRLLDRLVYDFYEN